MQQGVNRGDESGGQFSYYPWHQLRESVDSATNTTKNKNRINRDRLNLAILVIASAEWPKYM